MEMFVIKCGCIDYGFLEKKMVGTLRAKSIGGSLRNGKMITGSERRGEIS